MGGTIGGLLLQSDFSVELVARGDHGHRIREEGLSLRFPDRHLTVHPPCFESIDEIVWRPDDMVMVATKLQDAKSVMDQLVRADVTDLPVICASNGMHGEQWARQRFQTALSMLVWMPATHLQAGEVLVHSVCPGVLDTGPVHSGSAYELQCAESLCSRLRRAGFDAEARPDIRRWKYAKWVTNLGSAAQALVTDDWKSVAEAARREGEAVLTAAGVDRVTVAELLERCHNVQLAAIDGEYRQGGSTWQSHQLGKSLESAYIEGAMADLGDRFGIPVPVNRLLAEVAKDPRPLTAAEVLGKQR